jgi:hypothetical protein
MFNTKSAPKLRGKAAEVKDLGPIMVAVWGKFKNPRITLHENIAVVLAGSAHLDKILSEHPGEFVLPEDAAKDLLSTAHVMMSTWYGLARHFQTTDVPLFGITAKAHLLLHCCMLSRRPRANLRERV